MGGGKLCRSESSMNAAAALDIRALSILANSLQGSAEKHLTEGSQSMYISDSSAHSPEAKE